MIRDGPRTAFEERINLAAAKLTAASVDTPFAPGPGWVLTGEVVPIRSDCLKDLDVVPSGSVPHFTKVANANLIKKAEAYLNEDVSPSQLSATQAMNAPSFAVINNERLLMIGQDFGYSSDVGQSDASPSVAADRVPSDAKSVSGTRSTLIKIPPVRGCHVQMDG